ncbi:hypothetical protein KFE25_000921 [Diacronema lutheri]|uniref:Uncharacterized protein n=1 Tax=Diacronema lutheri TaxID=2081491 RepID=A0A8J5XIS7_DIALT|nr:hypothetical protein KFE25_000921 [Diacronema lutheri]
MRGPSGEGFAAVAYAPDTHLCVGCTPHDLERRHAHNGSAIYDATVLVPTQTICPAHRGGRAALGAPRAGSPVARLALCTLLALVLAGACVALGSFALRRRRAAAEARDAQHAAAQAASRARGALGRQLTLDLTPSKVSHRPAPAPPPGGSKGESSASSSRSSSSPTPRGGPGGSRGGSRAPEMV